MKNVSSPQGIFSIKESINAKKKKKDLVPMKVKALVAQLCPILCNLLTIACQAPLSMELSRQEDWSM